MKTKIYLLILIMHPLVLLSQDPVNPARNPDITNNNTSDERYGRDKRISFIVGMGASYITNNLYQDPVINKTNNHVIIANAIKLKTNLSLGIVYTSKVVDNLVSCQVNNVC